MPILKRLDVGFGIGYGNAAYSIQDQLTSGFGVSFNLKESMTLLSFPFSVKYYFLNSRLRPFAQLGAKYTRLLSSEISGNRSGGPPATISENTLEMRNKKLFFASVGVGAQYLLRKGYFFVEVTYFKGTTDMVDSSNRYANADLLFGAGYVADDFKLSSLAINFGYAFSLFKD